MFSNSNGGFKKTFIKVQERTIYKTEPNNKSYVFITISYRLTHKSKTKLSIKVLLIKCYVLFNKVQFQITLLLAVCSKKREMKF